MTPGDLVLTPRGIRFLGRVFPCAIGRNGISPSKREGDGTTPAGVHRIVGMLYRADRIARPAHPVHPAHPALCARPIGPGDLWSDDGGDDSYNHPVRVPHRQSHEKLRRGDPLYDLVLITDWNWPNAVPGRGSAVFLHQWRHPRYPTEGCIALRRDHLRWISRHVAPGTRLIIPGA